MSIHNAKQLNGVTIGIEPLVNRSLIYKSGHKSGDTILVFRLKLRIIKKTCMVSPDFLSVKTDEKQNLTCDK